MAANQDLQTSVDPKAALGQYRAIPPTLADKEVMVLQLDNAGNLKIVGAVGGTGNAPGRSRVVSSSITKSNSATAYAPGQVVGTASSHVITLAGASQVNNGSGVIIGVALLDEANQTLKGDFDLFIFTATITGQADYVAFAPTNAEMETCLARVQFIGGNATVANAASGASGNVFYPSPLTNTMTFQTGAVSTSLFACLVARSAYTPVVNEKFYISLRVLQD
jgi:hypothetical protein